MEKTEVHSERKKSKRRHELRVTVIDAHLVKSDMNNGICTSSVTGVVVEPRAHNLNLSFSAEIIDTDAGVGESIVSDHDCDQSHESNRSCGSEESDHIPSDPDPDPDTTSRLTAREETKDARKSSLATHLLPLMDSSDPSNRNCQQDFHQDFHQDCHQDCQQYCCSDDIDDIIAMAMGDSIPLPAALGPAVWQGFRGIASDGKIAQLVSLPVTVMPTRCATPVTVPVVTYG